MKTQAIILAFLATASIVNSVTVADLGKCFGSLNTAGSLALVDDASNSRNTCLVSSVASSVLMVELFDASKYVGLKIEPAQFFDKYNQVQKYLQGQNNQCGTNNLLTEFDRRLKNNAALGGLVANLIGQAVVWKKSQLYKSYNAVQTAYTNFQSTGNLETFCAVVGNEGALITQATFGKSINSAKVQPESESNKNKIKK
ncbi:UNKNOWN [Stylonychia lemnae]|uniref:Uncharacterized protein n=1 Tax=Stylonychia lemnae TaxID=5949 RepID=A0A078A2U9_STYLE|nr:UNKNOWN [Stylonychia lemnae]|eukprot:CDW75818.1 UNKNOWN [Stylonychia lemnae]